MYASEVYNPLVSGTFTRLDVITSSSSVNSRPFCHHCRNPYPLIVVCPAVHTHIRRLSSPYCGTCFACSALRAVGQHIPLFQEQRRGWADHRALLDSSSLLNCLPTSRRWTSALSFLSPFPIYAMRGLSSFRTICSRICKILGREGFTGSPWMLSLQKFEWMLIGTFFWRKVQTFRKL